MKLFILITLLTSTACATILKPRDIIRACTAEQLEMCGDLICEGDLDFDQVIAGTASAIELCFEHTEIIGKKYFDKKKQQEVFKRYKVEGFFK